MRSHAAVAAAAALCAASTLAIAGPVTESEPDGSALNNTLAAAQLIPTSAFTSDSNPEIFPAALSVTIRGRAGGGDVDVYAFNAPAGSAFFDVDHASFDTYLALYDSVGTLLAANDDSFPADPGSASDRDAFLGVVNLPASGRYYVAVSSAGNTPNAAFSGGLFNELFRPDGVFGGFAFANAGAGDSSYTAGSGGVQEGLEYTLHVSVPAPGTGGLALAAMLGLRRRR